MKTIFLDESGYTGEDLLNTHQPFFVLASLDVSEVECNAYKKHYFSKVKSKELKYSSLKKYKNQQDMIIDFLSSFLKKKDNYQICIAHKKYVLIQKLVDFLIEPFVHEMGEDLYLNGQNIALSNLLYSSLPAFGGKIYFDELLIKFQIFIREQTILNYEKLFSLINQVSDNNDLNEILDLIRPSYEIIGHRLLELIPPNSLDLSFTFGLTTMAKWRNGSADDIVLIHDQTSNMSKQIVEWKALMSGNLEEQTLGWDKRTLNLPINISETKFCNSESWTGLQIADILAGASAHSAKWQISKNKSKDDFGEKVFEIFKDVNLSLSLLPSNKVTPEELGTLGPKHKDSNEIIGKIIFSAKNKHT
ncbi:MAG: DUF3800 domain-containing protein [Calditrichaeota bacterium]|nr:MAG: DUF3800 domain-containing protein [Calditrichota bacterium]MBL1208130.1 DUF3800 domain-containing protein [Calditrichota bacterium]NOG47968.1 DUF3800 domain-containing protein [Calditrichota bacterium]